MNKIGFIAIILLVVIVIGLGATGTLTALNNGYNKITTNQTVKKIESEAIPKIESLQPDVKNLIHQATANTTGNTTSKSSP